MPSAERDPSRDDLQGVLDEFLEAFGNLDLDRFLALWAHDATVIHPAAQKPRRLDGWEMVRDGWQELFEFLRAARPGPPYVDLRPVDLRVQSVGTGVVVVTFHLDLGQELGFGRRTLVLRAEGGLWKIVHLHASNV
jgi:ketosteroid isomerase-like protein